MTAPVAPDAATPLDTAPLAAAGAMPDARDGVELARPGRQRSVAMWLAVGWIGLVVALGVLAPVLPIADHAGFVGDKGLRPGLRWPEPLGTDSLGRSLTSRVIVGARVSMLVGFASVALAMVAGGLIGLVAGYFRRRVDAVISIGVDTLLAFPPLVLLLALTAVAPRGVPTLIVSLALLITPTFARLTRANALAFGQREVVTASRGMGSSHLRVLRRDVVPNIFLPVVSYSFVVVAVVIVAEGSLSFLGLGVPPPTPSWGGMIAAGKDKLETEPYLVFVPAAFMLLTVLSCNVIGDWMRVRFAVRR